MPAMASNHFPFAVVLDLAFSGYGILRSLHSYQIPLIGFYNSKSLPESYTRLCDRKILFSGQQDLLNQLLRLSDNVNEKPVLILTTDSHVEFFIRNREALENRYLINMPDKEVVDLLLNKNKFAVFAKANNILIPQSMEVSSFEQAREVKNRLSFPVIVKPYKRTERWERSGYEKAYIVADYEKFIRMYESFSRVEDHFLVQQYIQGNDSNIEYCLTYFSKDSNCKMAFTGKKIRQWPVASGSTATTVPVENDFIRQETERIFKKLGYCGFGSIEYKRNDADNKYYLIEPTVGRLNQQEYVATLSGYNIPLAAYMDLTGISLVPREKKNLHVVYIDEIAEVCSTFVHFRRKLLTFSKWIMSLKGKRYYRFFNRNDVFVFGGLILDVFSRIFIFPGLRFRKPSTGIN